MPGAILAGLQKHLPEDMTEKIFDENGLYTSIMKTIEQGASTTVWAAVSDELEGVGGKYLENL